MKDAQTQFIQGTLELLILRTLIYGAAPMAVEWIDQVARAFADVGFSNSYGLTETAPDLTIFDPIEFRAEIERARATGDRKGPLTSVGKPNVLNEVRIVTPDGAEVKPREIGELLTRGPNIMKGYWKRPEETAAALRDGLVPVQDQHSMPGPDLLNVGAQAILEL